MRVDLPEEEMRKKTVFAAVKTQSEDSVLFLPDVISSQIEKVLMYSNDLNKVHRLMVRLLRCWGNKTVDMVITNPTALTIVAAEPSGDEIERARKLLLVHTMTYSEKALAEGRLDSLLPVWRGRILVTTGRLGDKSMLRLFGVSSLPIIMPKSRLAYLYMNLAHQSECGLTNTPVEHHRSAVGTLARSRTYVWIIKGKSLAKKVVLDCMKCRREQKHLESQQMGLLREAHLTVCPAWTYVSLDFCGPVLVSGEVQKRVTMKC